MSKLIVEVCRVEHVEPHPNADRLAIATVKGWKTCIRFDPETGKADFAPGDKCIYFPPDCVLPAALAHGPDDNPPGRLGVMQYLNRLPKDQNGVQPTGGRVKAARLRSVPSYGVITHLNAELGDDPNWEIGTDVAAHFGVTKWEPPLENVDGDAEPEHPRFHRYTDIENIGNFPGVIEPLTEVVFTEKIHGKNCRLGFIQDIADDGTESWLFMAGSHSLRRKELDAKGRPSDFWLVMTDNVRDMFRYIRDELPWHQPKVGIVLFGEIYGSGVQDMCYGLSNGRKGFRAFDLALNGLYVDYDLKVELCEKFNIEHAPALFRGPFDSELLEVHTSGPTTLCEPEEAGKFKGREGIVVTPVKEVIHSPVLGGRLIVKSLSVDYLARKGGTDAR